MPHLVINHLNPHPLAIILATTLPVFRMDQVDAAIFVGAAGHSAPVYILIPFDARAFDAIKAAQVRNRLVEGGSAVGIEEDREITVNLPAPAKRGKNHSHLSQ